MELKLRFSYNFCSEENTFNRTIMELKPVFSDGFGRVKASFNRTIMELKLGLNGIFSESNDLLIVPLWN